jgi:cytochrome b involved in lipid metabolism
MLNNYYIGDLNSVIKNKIKTNNTEQSNQDNEQTIQLNDPKETTVLDNLDNTQDQTGIDKTNTNENQEPSNNVGSGLTIEEVAKHNSQEDCWMIISNKVYDITSYLPFHPPGADKILPYCGKDGTTAFETKDKKSPKDHSQSAYNMLADYYVGDLVISSNQDSGGSQNDNQDNSQIPNQDAPQQETNPSENTSLPDQNNPNTEEIIQEKTICEIENIIQQKYPNSEIKEIKHNKELYEVFIIFNGRLYKIKMSLQGEIINTEEKDPQNNLNLELSVCEIENIIQQEYPNSEIKRIRWKGNFWSVKIIYLNEDHEIKLDNQEI